MKILCSCPVCDTNEEGIVAAHLRDDGAADVTCPLGHQFVVVSPHDKYEILFDAGSLALIDEYPREAVADFAAALEQFFAFFIQLVSDNYLIDENPDVPNQPTTVSDIDAAQTWSQVAAQSERQLGAFLYVYLLTMGTTYQLDKKGIELRNKVLHRGYLPTLHEATKYGEGVWLAIMATLEKMLDVGMLNVPTPGTERILDMARGSPHVSLLEMSHGLMLQWDPELGGFSERLFQMRTTWRRAVYGRGPRSDA